MVGGGVDPDLPLTPETIGKLGQEMAPEIDACLQSWRAEFPSISGQVLLAFSLDEQGVEEAWVDEHDAVPTPVLDCFSEAVFSLDWPAAPGGVEVSLPFEFDDEGLVPEEDGKVVDRR